MEYDPPVPSAVHPIKNIAPAGEGRKFPPGHEIGGYKKRSQQEFAVSVAYSYPINGFVI